MHHYIARSLSLLGLGIILQYSNFLSVFVPVFAQSPAMSAGTAEFAYVSLNEDAAIDILQPNTTAGQTADFMITQVLKQPGARHAGWALTEENPRQMRIWADWDSLQDHLNYQKTEYAPHRPLRLSNVSNYMSTRRINGLTLSPVAHRVYAEVQKKLYVIFDLAAPFSVCHLEPSNTALFLTDADTHPAVEVLTMGFPHDIEDATKAAVEAQFHDFADKALKGPGLCKSILAAWSVESNVPLPGLETGEGVQNGTVYIALISWRSVEEHMQNKELPAFKESVHLLRTLPRLVNLDVVHIVDGKTWVAHDIK